ncbi:hypothetical protein [uncultured Jannaschia sp.]|uniref:hypothetical protein n=1 Tax=uncultured Jannaschia sp. TaxID=293347 RepID=UPI0026161F66|nr:hypothetical protein [uncultured Jannaschia sp.]
MKNDLQHTLAKLQYAILPYHPIILVFATGEVSDKDCVPMMRSPMPQVGNAFGSGVIQILTEAMKVNSSIHDGAVIFTRDNKSESYRIWAWSMRIVSRHKPEYPEPNFGSAYNSVLSLSMAENIDFCCNISPSRAVFFQKGESYWCND